MFTTLPTNNLISAYEPIKHEALVAKIAEAGLHMVAGSNYWDQNIAVIVLFFVGILSALMLFANTVLTKRVAFAAI